MRKQGPKKFAFILSVVSLTSLSLLGLAPANASTPVASGAVSELGKTQVSVVGGWSGVVLRDGITDHISVVFETGGKLCLKTQDGSYPGRWSQSSPGNIAWQSVEVMPGNVGLIYVNQRGLHTRSAFLTRGVTTIKDNSGNVIGSVNATVVLGRDNSVTSTCK